jgi:hypothetical protein
MKLFHLLVSFIIGFIECESQASNLQNYKLWENENEIGKGRKSQEEEAERSK